MESALLFRLLLKAIVSSFCKTYLLTAEINFLSEAFYGNFYFFLFSDNFRAWAILKKKKKKKTLSFHIISSPICLKETPKKSFMKYEPLFKVYVSSW